MTTSISGFTFIHNALESGYPIIEAIRAVQPYVDEVVVVDMESADGTRELLEKIGNDFVNPYGEQYAPIIIVDGRWGNKAGETLREAHSKYIECSGDVIVHFEADEVYDDNLIKKIIGHIKTSKPENCHLSVMRLQLEQNFQRCRWYPEPTHRVFPRLSGARKHGHTTDQHDRAFLLTEKNGYLWDITNCFRDNWMARISKQSELWDKEPQYIMVPLHAMHKVEVTEAEAQRWLSSGKHWTYTNTPFNIPEILKLLVGMVKYEPSI
jgi:glycosyltransferase involved in cell wall biosynthesis